MVSASEVREAWKEHARLRPIAPTMALTAEGLVLGAGTVLAKRADRDGEPRLAIDGCEERLLALLSIAYGYAVSRAVLGSIRRAARDWSRGETCLAAIHLARSRLPPLPAGEAARFRLFASERLLDDGMAPRQILEDCEIDTAGLDMLKAGFNPAEPRVSAGLNPALSMSRPAVSISQSSRIWRGAIPSSSRRSEAKSRKRAASPAGSGGRRLRAR